MSTIKKGNLTTALINVILSMIIILAVIYSFVTKTMIIGPILIALGVIILIPLYVWKIPLSILKSEIWFGMIDNGVLAIFALSGAELFGVLGAIVGSLVGNAITDGLAGIFEGYAWQKTDKLNITGKRTALTVAIGKMAGCLWGGGLVLTIAWSILSYL